MCRGIYILLEQLFQTLLSTEAFAALIGAIIGGIMTIAGSIVFWWYQQRVELKNIAKGLFFDISNLEIQFNEYITVREKSISTAEKMAKDLGATVERAYMVGPIPFYKDTGLFYIFSKDIARFDNKLSSELYEFYLKVGYIEEIRRRLEEYSDRESTPNTLTVNEQNMIKVDNTYMVESIVEAQKLLLIIKQDLTEKYHIQIS